MVLEVQIFYFDLFYLLYELVFRRLIPVRSLVSLSRQVV